MLGKFPIVNMFFFCNWENIQCIFIKIQINSVSNDLTTKINLKFLQIEEKYNS